MLDQLLEAGLPHIGCGDGVLLDEKDLANISYAVGLRSARFISQRGWSSSLAQVAAGNEQTFDIKLDPHCPFPGHRGACSFELPFADRLEHPHDPPGATGSLIDERTIRVRTSTFQASAPEAIAEVLRCLADAEFVLLPEELDEDLSFLASSGLASCVLASKATLREACRLRVPARPSFGLIIVAPFAGVHWWVEFLIKNQWVASDPHLIKYLERWGMLKPGEWPRLASPAGVLLRLGSDVSDNACCAAISPRRSRSMMSASMVPDRSRRSRASG